MTRRKKPIDAPRPLTRCRRIHLTQLTAQDRALLRDTSVHAAALYNMALYELRQHWFATRDAKRAETGKETAYGDLISPYTLYHKLKTSEHYQFLVKFGIYIIEDAYRDMLGMKAKLAPFFQRVKASGGKLRERRPGLPRYKTPAAYFATLTARCGGKWSNGIRPSKDGHGLTWVLTKQMAAAGHAALTTDLPHDIPVDAVRDAKLIPAHGGRDWWAVIGYHKQPDTPTIDAAAPQKIMGIDVGVTNLMACVNLDDRDSFLIDGRRIKAINQWYNKERKRLQDAQVAHDTRPRYEVTDGAIFRAKTHGFSGEILANYTALNGQTFRSVRELQHALGLRKWERRKYNLLFSCAMRKNALPDTRQLYRITQRRNEQLRDAMRKAARYVIDYARDHGVTKVVVGKNPGWKTAVSMGRKSNQAFTQIPHNTMLLPYLKYFCEEAGIMFEELPESHTSKCSFLDGEPIEHHEAYVGRRIERGLFQAATGAKVNADCNGAANIAARGGWNGDRADLQHTLATPRRIPLRGELSHAHVSRNAEQRDGIGGRIVRPASRENGCPTSAQADASRRLTPPLPSSQSHLTHRETRQPISAPVLTGEKTYLLRSPYAQLSLDLPVSATRSHAACVTGESG